MANGTPLPKAAEIFNQLANLHIEDVVAARRFADEATALDGFNPGDFMTKVSLGEALLLSGRRSEAVKHLDAAYTLRKTYMYSVMDRLSTLLLFVADREKAITVVKEIALEPGMFGSADDSCNQAQIAAWAVDLELLQSLVERDKRAGVNNGLAQFYGAGFAEVGHAEEIALHQKILVDVVRDVQMAGCFTRTFDECGGSVFINNILFDESRISRCKLEEQAAAAIDFRLKGALDDIVTNVFTAAPSYAAARGLRVVVGDDSRTSA